MEAEGNKTLKFSEPYLLAMAANEEGRTGSQFFITFDRLTPLNGSKHTIFGRLIKGRDTLKLIEGVDEYRMAKEEISLRMA